MGEAKRRKQKLGNEYGQPLGLNPLERRVLIEENLQELLSAHYQACGYPDYAKYNNAPEEDTLFQTNSFKDFMPSLIQHWQESFNKSYPLSGLEMGMTAILQNAPIFLTSLPYEELKNEKATSPIIPFPHARKYFRKIFNTRHIRLSQHCILVRDVLDILATEKFSLLLEQLMTSEVRDVLSHAFDDKDDKEDWLLPYITESGLIDLTEEVIFVSGNRAIMGLMTLLLTLPWEIELKKLLVPSSI